MRLLRIGSSTGFREEIQDIASLHAQGGDGGQDARNVTVQVVANCTEMQCECNDNCKLKAQELVVICA